MKEHETNLKLIYADELLSTLRPEDETTEITVALMKDIRNLVSERINSLTTIDAVPVVRCKDCRHYVSYGYINNPEDLLYRCKFGIFNNQRDNKDSDYYCSYAEPRVNVMF